MWPQDFPDWARGAYPIVWSRVYWRLRRRCGVPHERAAELAEDAVQHAMLQAARRLGISGYFQSFVHFVRWLTVVAGNQAVDRVQRERAGQMPENYDVVNRERLEFHAAVWNCLNRLPSPERQVLILHYVDGLTDVEAGQVIFDPSDGTPEALGQRARRIRLRGEAMLRACLLRHGFDPESWTIDLD